MGQHQADRMVIENLKPLHGPVPVDFVFGMGLGVVPPILDPDDVALEHGRIIHPRQVEIADSLERVNDVFRLDFRTDAVWKYLSLGIVEMNPLAKPNRHFRSVPGVHGHVGRHFGEQFIGDHAVFIVV